MSIDVKIEYSNISHFPRATVDGHSGKLIFGINADKPLKEAVEAFYFLKVSFVNNLFVRDCCFTPEKRKRRQRRRNKNLVKIKSS